MATPPGMGAHIKKLKEAPETAMTGSRWTPEEDEKLLLARSANKTVYEIALEHQRTVGAIESRLRAIALRMLDVDKTPIETISIKLGLSSETILLAQKKATKPKKAAVKAPGVETPGVAPENGKPESMLDVLKQIRDVLLRIEINTRQNPK